MDGKYGGPSILDTVGLSCNLKETRAEEENIEQADIVHSEVENRMGG